MHEANILSVRDIRVHFKVKGKGRMPWTASRTLRRLFTTLPNSSRRMPRR